MSIYTSAKPLRNAAHRGDDGVHEPDWPPLRKPTTGRAARCARATNGHAVAELAIPLIKSRRRIASPRGSGPRQISLPINKIKSRNRNQRNGVQWSICAAEISRCAYPLSGPSLRSPSWVQARSGPTPRAAVALSPQALRWGWRGHGFNARRPQAS